MMHLKGHIAFIVFILMAGFAFAQEESFSLQLNLDRTEIKIGEQITAELVLIQSVNSNLLLPELKDTLSKEIEIIELGKIDTNYEGSNLEIKKLSRRLVLTSWDTGYHAIPPLELITKTISVKSEPILIHVMGVEVEIPEASVEEEPKIEIKDIKDIREANFSLWEWIKMNYYWILLGLLILGAIFYYIKYIHPKLKNKTIPISVKKRIVPPYEIAFQKLNKLDNKKLWQSGKIKPYYIELSEVIREYIENQLKIPALESTSIEIIEALDRSKVKEELRLDIKEMLELSDLVKFAKYLPLSDENSKCMEIAYRFVTESKPNLDINQEVIEEKENV